MPSFPRILLGLFCLLVAILLLAPTLVVIPMSFNGNKSLAFPPVEGSPKAVADLGRWNYAIGLGLLMLGLMVSAHPSTPLGRGRGVVAAMLGCFLVGLLWICTFYVFSDDLSKIWVFNDLGQWNLVVGIAFMAVGFSFATKWE